jgi:outer membrane protein assembly complex protein YaeT
MRLAVTLSLIAQLVLAASVRAQEPAAARYVGRPITNVTIHVDGAPSADPALVELIETRAGQPLTMADVRETIAHFQSLGRFEQVELDAEASASGVDLRYDLHPVHGVSKVDFRGDLGVSEGTLRDWMSSRYGNTPPAGRAADVASTLAELYRDHGYMTATVRAAPPIVEGSSPQTTLVFTISAGPLARIRNVTIEGTPLDPKERVLGLLGAEPGKPYDRTELRKRLNDYLIKMRRRGYYQATATDQPATLSEDGAQADLLLTIFPGPLVKVQYDGATVPKERLAEMVPIEREGSVDEDLLEDSSRRIEEYLRQQGYYKARVTHERIEQDSVLTIVFHINQDRLYRVAPGGVEISGNHSVPIEELKPFVKLSAGDPFISAKLDVLTNTIKQLYQRRGFSTVNVASGVNEVGDGLVHPTVVITEGPRAVIGNVTITGSRALKAEDLLHLLESRSGQPFYGPTVISDREKIRVEYLNAGFASVQVNVAPVLSADAARADLPFKVEEGPQTIVDHILIVGNTRTDPRVIRRELQFSEGKPLGQEALVESQRRLSALGLFRRVRIAPLQHGTPTNPDVIVTVEEALRTTIGYGGGAEVDQVLKEGPEGQAQQDLEFAPRGFFEVGRRNLWGKNRTANLYTRISLHPNDNPDDPKTFGFTEYRVVGTYREPKAVRGKADLTLTAAIEQGRRTSFNFSRKGVNAELTQRLSDLVRGSFRYSFGTTRTFDEHLSEEDKLTIDRLFPQVRLSAFSVAVSRDSRDDLLEPQHGTLVSLDGTLAARAIGSQVGYSKGYLQGFYYHSLGHPRLVFAGGARVGLANPFTVIATVTGPDGNVVPVKDLPASERFFAGGDTTVRGYALDTVGAPATISPEGFPIGGNATVILNAELRAPVWRDVGAAFFLDAGNVWARTSNFDLTDLLGAVGFGLRYHSPIGPIRLDLGFKLDRRVLGGELEPRTALHFSIGQAF